jgi:predicted ArsR family transcriptional regulator
MFQKRVKGSAGGAVLAILQRRGPLTVKEMEVALGVTATAVRQQIAGLLAEEYIAQREEHNGRGRPKHVYSLTVKGRSLFPQHYDELTHTLLHEILLSDGPQKVQFLLARLGNRMAEQYAGQMSSLEPVDRAQELTELLNAKGILAEVEVDSGSISFREFNCPYYQLARDYRAICDMEQGMLSQVIQQPVALVGCILDGHHGCQFKIEPK